MRDPKTEGAALRVYEASLIVPPQLRRKLLILCRVGLVGAGKTTVMKPLAERLSLLRISGDDIRRLLKERGLGYDAVPAIMAALARKYLSIGVSVAIDSDMESPHNRELAAACEREYGAMPIWIHVNPPEAFILRKLRTFEHTWLFKNAEEAVENYMNRKPLHRNLQLPFLYAFDTSKENLDAEIEKAAKIVEKKAAL